MKATNSIGILREVKNKWERRVAITPSEVKKLVDRNIKVLVEPCERRIFKDLDYKQAGAIITNDLSPASFIVGVKDIESSKLYENHSYLNFAHVIKGQEANMPYLDECFAKNIRLFDYECIKDPHTRLRTVAFGRFAGLAGMITGMRGLGEHLLAQGAATPFLNMSSCYMYNSLDDAQSQVIKIGQMIEKYGLPQKNGPFVFTFTGGGNVTKGALEIFKLLPHEFVDANDLKSLKNNFDCHKVYGCVLKTQNIVQHRKHKNDFAEQHYFENPEQYEPVFHDKIAPYTSVLVNGMYWDHRYPRLLTIEQMKDLSMNCPQCMLALFDISCDPEGAVEFLKKTTNTDAPYFTYNAVLDEVTDVIDGDGVLVLAVDALPAELPKDSSIYFSHLLHPYLERLATSHSDLSLEEQEKHLGPEMFGAMITWNGALTPNFKYIQTLRREQKEIGNVKDARNKILKIDGHLFDSGIINQILDMIEVHNAQYTILDLHSKVNTRQLQKASRLIIQIEDDSDSKMDELIEKLQTLCNVHPKAEAKLVILPFGAGHSNNHRQNNTKQVKKANIIKNERDENVKPKRKILIFGSGFVSKPCIDYLSLSGNNTLCIASNDVTAAKVLCEGNKYANYVSFDANNDDVDGLVSTHDIVISLLPSTMHIPIAKSCIKYGKDLVTASYISDEMKHLNDEAIAAKVILLNECGLDPGLDHMSAVSLINGIESDEVINGFYSYCGGLPSPQAATNAFGYKFSWSPIGVLAASKNSAKYLENGNLREIEGEKLLLDGFGRKKLENYDNPYPSLSLEHLANRDCLKYIEKYKLDKNEIQNMYRGTLRYYGFCDMLHGCKVLGLLDAESGNGNVKSVKGETWYHYLWRVIHHKLQNERLGVDISNCINDENEEDALKILIENVLIKEAKWSNYQIQMFLSCLENDLNVFDVSECVQNEHDNVMNAFCELLQDKLCFDDVDERDMVVMINKISTSKDRMYESSLLVFGDETYSAMARTVGFPLAIATQFLLNGDLPKNQKGNIGILDATHPRLSDMVLDKCKDHGIEFKQRILSNSRNEYKVNLGNNCMRA